MTVKQDLENRIKDFADQHTLAGDALAELCKATMAKMPEETLNKEIEENDN